MVRTNIKVRVKDGTRWLTRTVYKKDGTHYIKLDDKYFEIRKTDKGIYKAGWYNRVEYIEE